MHTSFMLSATIISLICCHNTLLFFCFFLLLFSFAFFLLLFSFAFFYLLIKTYKINILACILLFFPMSLLLLLFIYMVCFYTVCTLNMSPFIPYLS